MANKLVGYYNNTDIFQADWIYAFSSPNIASGDKIISITQNDATKFALIAIPSGSGSSRNYEVYLFSNSTVNYTINRNYRSRYYNGNVDPGWDNWSEGPMYESTYNSYSAESPTPAWSYYPIRCQLGGISYKMLDENNLPIFVDSNKNPIEFINILDSDWNRTVIQDFILEVMGKPAIPPKGQGTVTLEIPANGANLTFTSALLGVSVTKMISKDDVVNIEGEPVLNWEVMLLLYYSPIAEINREMLVNNEYEIINKAPVNSGIDGNLLTQNSESYTINAKVNTYAYSADMEANDSLSMKNYSAGELIATVSTGSGENSLIIIASKTSISTLPFEVLFMWHNGSARVATILKRDGAKIGNNTTITGEYISDALNGSTETITVSAFNGIIKVFKNGVNTISMDASSGYSFSSSESAIWIIFAIPA